MRYLGMSNFDVQESARCKPALVQSLAFPFVVAAGDTLRGQFGVYQQRRSLRGLHHEACC